MGSVAFMVLMIMMLGTGFFMSVASIVCLVIFSRRKKAGKKYGKSLTIISKIALAVGILIMICPIGFFTFIAYVNTAKPSDYVETEIMIEEDGFQDSRFTANGVVYEVLPLEPNYNACAAVATPVFSYETSGFLDRSQCGNYYSVENNQGFDLIWSDAGYLFCPENDVKKIEDYYTNEDSSEWYFFKYGEEAEEFTYPVTQDVGKELGDFVKNDADSMEETKVVVKNDMEFTIIELSNDNLVTKYHSEFIVKDGSLYLVNEKAYDSETDIETYSVIKVPDQIDEKIVEEYGDADF